MIQVVYVLVKGTFLFGRQNSSGSDLAKKERMECGVVNNSWQPRCCSGSSMIRLQNPGYKFGEICVYKSIASHLCRPMRRNYHAKFTQLITTIPKLINDAAATAKGTLKGKVNCGDDDDKKNEKGAE